MRNPALTRLWEGVTNAVDKYSALSGYRGARQAAQNLFRQTKYRSRSQILLTAPVHRAIRYCSAALLIPTERIKSPRRR